MLHRYFDPGLRRPDSIYRNIGNPYLIGLQQTDFDLAVFVYLGSISLVPFQFGFATQLVQKKPDLDPT
jgi:hypothetical protein